MSIFAAAIDDLFADPELARDALWRAGGNDPAVPVRIIARRPDRISEFGDTRVAVPTAMFDVRVSEVPAITEGDSIEVDGAMFVVQGEALRDAEGLVWTVEAHSA